MAQGCMYEHGCRPSAYSSDDREEHDGSSFYEMKIPGWSSRGHDISGHKFWNENWIDFTTRFDEKYNDKDQLETE